MDAARYERQALRVLLGGAAGVYPGTEEQTCCWFHKAGNVLDKMPKSVQGRAKTMIREMWQAPSLTEAEGAYDQFCAAWQTK